MVGLFMDKNIRTILNLMEDMSSSGATSILSGGAMAQMGQSAGMERMPGDSIISMTEIDDDSTRPEDLVAAKRFVQQVGSVDKARELIDKIDDVVNILDDGNNGCENDEHVIGMMAALIPDGPDLPTGVAPDMMRQIASQINPSHRSM